MLDYNTQKQMISSAMAEFPATFGLLAFPGETFRISVSSSYVNDSGAVMLYTEIRKGDTWRSFCKGTAQELRSQLTR